VLEIEVRKVVAMAGVAGIASEWARMRGRKLRAERLMDWWRVASE
jgi:hypothetical protein